MIHDEKGTNIVIFGSKKKRKSSLEEIKKFE